MKYRHHRGGLAESMETVREIEPTIAALEALLRATDVTVEKYGYGIDERIGWDTHLVCVNGIPAGFTDGPAT